MLAHIIDRDGNRQPIEAEPSLWAVHYTLASGRVRILQGPMTRARAKALRLRLRSYHYVAEARVVRWPGPRRAA
jgi:hypothetical protein